MQIVLLVESRISPVMHEKYPDLSRSADCRKIHNTRAASNLHESINNCKDTKNCKPKSPNVHALGQT